MSSITEQVEAAAGAPPAEPEAPAVEPAAGLDERANLLAKVRGLREEAKRDHHLDVAIPGLKDYVWMRFRPFPVAKTERKTAEFQKLAGAKAPVILKAACDTLIDATEQILLLPESKRAEGPGVEGENLIAIDPDAAPLIGFDSRLAELFGFTAQTARQVVLGMFPTEQAVIAVHVRVSQWMTDVTRESDENTLGN